MAELKVFLRRCIDVIEFLNYIETEVDKLGRQFIDLMRSFGPEALDDLSKEQYRDLVTNNSCALVHLLMERLTSLEITEDS